MLILFAIFAYLLGSIPFGKIVGNLHGIDIQKNGSGNIGFANAARVLGWKLGLIVLAGDVLKGFVPTIIAAHYLPFDQALIVGFVAILAHIFPVWLRFKGGKGVATGLGISLALSPVVALLGFASYLIVFIIARKSAVASVTAAWSLGIWSFVVDQRYIGFTVVLAVLATWTHRSNLKNYRSGRHAR